MNEKTKAYLAALSFSAIIGFSFLFTKIALGYASPLTNLAHRYTIAALVLVILHQTKLINVSLSRKDILSILPMSLFYPLLFLFSNPLLYSIYRLLKREFYKRLSRFLLSFWHRFFSRKRQVCCKSSF